MSQCENGYVLDSVDGLCYLVLPITLDYDGVAWGQKGCYKHMADAVTFEMDNEVKELLYLLKSGMEIKKIEINVEVVIFRCPWLRIAQNILRLFEYVCTGRELASES